MLLAFLAEVALITYRDFAGTPAQKAGHTVAGLPLPSEYLAAVVIFGALGLVPSSSPAHTAATLGGWGIVIATYLNLVPGIPKLNQPATDASTSTQGAVI